jgi:archaellum component FlaC
MRWLFCRFAVWLTILGLTSTARAEIYKYIQSDGTVTYTDQLSQLPPERRAHYNRERERKEAERRELESRLGADGLKALEDQEAQEAELKRKIAAADEEARKQALEAQLKAIEASNQADSASEAQWKQRVQGARAELDTLLATFKRKQTEYSNIAIRVDFALLPGQAQKRDALRLELQALEKQIDAKIIEVEQTIPEAARKAGVPPGWIR